MTIEEYVSLMVDILHVYPKENTQLSVEIEQLIKVVKTAYVNEQTEEAKQRINDVLVTEEI